MDIECLAESYDKPIANIYKIIERYDLTFEQAFMLFDWVCKNKNINKGF